MKRRPLLVCLVAVVVVSMVVVALGATASHPPARVDPAPLDGRTPRSIELAATLSTGGSLSASGTIWIDTLSSALSAELEVPIVTAPTAFSVRAIDGRLYVTSPNLADASGPQWYTLALSWPSITRLAHALVRPDPALLGLLAHTRVTHAGAFSTYEGSRANVSLNTFGSSSASGRGTLELRLTTGRQGEFTGLWVRFTSGANTTTVDLQVLSYNRPHVIVAPPASRATQSASPLLSELVKSGELGSLVVPAALLKLAERTR